MGGRPKTDYLLVPEIEKILMACSDGSYDEATKIASPVHSVTISRIQNELKERFGHEVDTGTIRRILHARNEGPFGRTPVWLGDLVNASLWCFAKSDAKNSDRFYYVVREVDKSQVLYLAQLLRSTSSSGTANDALYTLTGMLCENDQEKFKTEVSKTLEKPNPLEIHFADTLRNVDVLQKAIDTRQPVNYRYVSNSTKGYTKEKRIPLCIEICEGYPYLVEKAKNGFRMVRIDAMRDVTIGGASKVRHYPKNEEVFEKLKEEAHAFVRGAVNRMAGNNVHVVARCHDDRMRKYVCDIFGNKEGFRAIPMGCEGRQDYEFWASYKGTVVQAIKWEEWFEILEPNDLREKVINTIKNNSYGKFEEA